MAFSGLEKGWWWEDFDCYYAELWGVLEMETFTLGVDILFYYLPCANVFVADKLRTYNHWNRDTRV